MTGDPHSAAREDAFDLALELFRRARDGEDVAAEAAHLPPGVRAQLDALLGDAAPRTTAGAAPGSGGETVRSHRDPLPVSPSSIDDDDAAAHTLGPYRLVRELGRGGQGVVHLARDTRLGRQVAIKLLDGAAARSADAYARFRREAQAASRLSHRGICTVHEMGLAGTTPYIAMEYVEGETLRSLLDRDASPPPDGTVAEARGGGPSSTRTSAQVRWAVQLVAEAAEALEVAHRAGIIHRDIKPGNIMLARDGRPVLLDFGLARIEDGDDAAMTRSGDVFGTPVYLSPERLVRGARVDQRTDVYALGATLYEILAGRPPFVEARREDLYRAIRMADPPDLRRLNPHAGGDLRAVVETALEKNPDRRYASAAAFAADLRAVLEHRPVSVKPVGAAARALRWTRRRPLASALVAATALALLAAAGVIGHGLARLPEIRRGREELRRQAIEDRLADIFLEDDPMAAAAACAELLADEPDVPEALAFEALSLASVGRGADAFGRLERQSALRARHPDLEWARHAVLWSLGRIPEADALRSTLGEPHTSLGCWLRGMAAMTRGRLTQPGAFAEARDSFQAAILWADRARPHDHVLLLRAAAACGDVATCRRLVGLLPARWGQERFGWRIRAECALGLFGVEAPAAIAACDAILRGSPGDVDFALRYAKALKSLERWTEMIAACDRVLERRPGHARALQFKGSALRGLGRRDEGIAALEAAAAGQPGEFSPVAELAVAYAGAGRAAEAEEMLRRARERPAPVHAFSVLEGNVRFAEERWEEAVAAFRRHLELNPGQGFALAYLGHALTHLGRLREALPALREAVRAMPSSVQFRHWYGLLLLEARQPEEAYAVLEPAVRAQPRGLTLEALGVCLLELGRLDEASQRFEESGRFGMPEGAVAAHRETVARARSLGQRLKRLARDEDVAAPGGTLAELARQARALGDDPLAVRLYRDAFERAPSLAAFYGIDAALAAARAGLGRSEPAFALDTADRRALLDQAREWLRAVRPEGGALETFDGEVRALIVETHPDLRALRETAALPDGAREEWDAFWKETDALLDSMTPAPMPAGVCPGH